MENELIQSTTIDDDSVELSESSEKKDTESKAKGFLFYIKLCWPILIFPLLYFPYSEWWRLSFADWAIGLAHYSDAPIFRLMITGNNTILLFWCIVTVCVMLITIILAILRARPWYVIPIYISVMFSLCGICSLFFYTLVLR